MKQRWVLWILIGSVVLMPIGAFGFSRVSLSPMIRVAGVYNDNVTLENDELKQDDYAIGTSADLVLNIAGRRSDIYISYRPDYIAYLDLEDESGWRHVAEVNAMVEVTKDTTLNISDLFEYSELPTPLIRATYLDYRQRPAPEDTPLAAEAPDDDQIPFDEETTRFKGIALSQEFPEIDTIDRDNREKYYYNLGQVNLEHRLNSTDSISAGYTYNIFRDDDPESGDSEEYGPQAGLVYWLRSDLGFDLSGSYTRGLSETSSDLSRWTASLATTYSLSRIFDMVFTYTHQDIDYDDRDQIDYRIYQPEFGVRYTTRGGEEIYVSAGYYYQDRQRGSNESGFVFGGNLAKTWTDRRSSLSLSGGSGTEENFFGDEALGFSVFYEGHLRLRYLFGRYESMRLSTSYRLTEYPNLDFDRKDNNVDVALTYQINNLALIGSGGYRYNDNINAAGDTEEIYDLGGGIAYRPSLARWMIVSLTYIYQNHDLAVDSDDYEVNQVALEVGVAPEKPYPLVP